MNRTLLALVVIFTGSFSFSQTCHPGVIETTPTNDFSINDDGTVTHTKTGLVWMQCAVGQIWNNGDCSGALESYNWEEALATAEAFNFSGYDDWRLPNIKELHSIVEYSCTYPSINLTAFPSAPDSPRDSWFWSSTPDVDEGYYAWARNFFTGYNYKWLKGGEYSVRLVRGQ